MHDSAESGEQETTILPASLHERSSDPKRLLQAAQALGVLETDLRTLLEKVPFADIGPDVIDYAVSAYQSLRGVVLDALDDEGRASADDEAIGMPTIEGNASFSTLLLKLSQATRFVGVEERWPSAFVMSLVQEQQLKGQMKVLGASGGDPSIAGGMLGLKGLGAGEASGPGYL